MDIDYLRIGTSAPPQAPEITAFNYDPQLGEINITWKSVQEATSLIESSATLQKAVLEHPLRQHHRP